MAFCYLFIITLYFVSSSIYAAPANNLDLSIGLLYENSDNIFLKPQNQKDENIIHSIFNINYQRKSATLVAYLNLRADHQNYLKETFPNQTVVSSVFSLKTTLSKQRLFWDINDRLDKVQIDHALPTVPANQENANYFTTGPNFVFFSNNKSRLETDIKYENLYLEKSIADYSGYLVDLSYIRNISHTTSIGLIAQYNDRTFDDKTLNADYSRSDVSLRINKKMKLSEIELDIGKTKLKPKSADSRQNSMLKAKYRYQLGQKTVINASFLRGLSDFTNAFAAGNQGDATYTNVSDNVFLLNQGQLSFSRNFGFSTIQYNYIYVQNDYNNDVLDVTTNSSNLAFVNRLTTSVNFKMNWIYQEAKFPALPRKDTTRIYRLGLIKTFLDVYDITLNIQYSDRGSTDINSIYTERRISLGGNYYFR